MLYLADTGILLRLFNKADPDCVPVRNALLKLRRDGHGFVVSTQNIAEFWNVSTRPASARGGFGLSIEETDRRVRVIERLCTVLPENASGYAMWRNLVKTHSVQGVQVHDARLAAWMLSHAVSHLLTLNEADFARYPNITAVSPASVLAAKN